MTEEVAMMTESKQAEKGLMKAIVRDRYGSPDVLQLKEVEKPAPNDVRGVLVKIYASSVNPADRYDVRGPPFLIRLVLPLFRMGMGLRRPKEAGVGSDIAGRVAANRSFEESAAVPIAGFTALQALRNHGHIKPGQKVLVNGAGGGVGTFAIQIAKSFGAEVTAVTNTQNLDLVRSIGADHVIDYTKEDFARNGQRYDLVCDIAASHSISDYKRIMNPNGTCVIVGMRDKIVRRLLYFAIRRRLALRGDKKFVFFIAKSNQEDFVALKELMEEGKIVPVIDRRYTLSETAQAIKYLEEGHARGKVIITMDHIDSKVQPVGEWSR